MRPRGERRAVPARASFGIVTPKRLLLAIGGMWTALALTVAIATPAWEANDEPDHVRNVQTLLSGNWYRIGPGGGFEPHQAPLYYLTLAGWQGVLGVAPQMPAPVLLPLSAGTSHGNYQHAIPSDGSDQRRVALLRIPGVAFGLITIVLTAAIARRISDDPWTPAVAAGIVAGVPKFTFVSGVVNNDNLANVLGALVTLCAVSYMVATPGTRRGRLLAACGLGLLVGAVMLTKITGAMLAVGALASVLLVSRRVEWRLLIGVFCTSALAVCGWWLISNWIRYGDPLAAGAFRDYFEDFFPPLLDTAPPLEQAVSVVPKDFYKSVWYSSGHNQFVWRFWTYLPLWLLTIAGLAGFAFRAKATPSRRAIVVLALLAAGGLSTVWILGLQTTTSQGRLAFIGLPAFACLLALGIERWPGSPALRFALPMIGMLGTVVAIQRDIFDIYY